MKTSGQVCRELKIPFYRLDYLLRNGFAEEPKRVGFRRIFTEEDIKRLKEVLILRS